jgi:hypothetical protein
MRVLWLLGICFYFSACGSNSDSQEDEGGNQPSSTGSNGNPVPSASDDNRPRASLSLLAPSLDSTLDPRSFTVLRGVPFFVGMVG